MSSYFLFPECGKVIQWDDPTSAPGEHHTHHDSLGRDYVEYPVPVRLVRYAMHNQEEQNDECLWTYNVDYDKWYTGCGDVSTLIAEGSRGNYFVYCPYCGLFIRRRNEAMSERGPMFREWLDELLREETEDPWNANYARYLIDKVRREFDRRFEMNDATAILDCILWAEGLPKEEQGEEISETLKRLADE